jgi:hypothetical protein
MDRTTMVLGRRLRAAPTITTSRQLLTDYWTVDIDPVEAAINRFETDRPWKNNCRVTFFEIAGDEHLHVNLTQSRFPKAIRGWAGPGRVPEGFVHNRRFRETRAKAIAGQVLAALRQVA